MMKLTQQDILNFEQRYRTSFINSLAGFRQAVLVGTRSTSGVSNLAIFNSLIHLGAHPPLYGLMSRPDSVQRDTLTNILETGYYTFNLVAADDFEKAHQTSARYTTSEFEAVGYTEMYQEGFFAPFVQEGLVKIGMKFQEKIPIAINGTVLIIGSVEQVEIPDQWVGEDGYVNLAEAGVLVSCGLDAYFKTTEMGRLSYAKPDRWPERL